MKKFIIPSLKHMDCLEMKLMKTIHKLSIHTLKVVKSLKKVRLVKKEIIKQGKFWFLFL